MSQLLQLLISLFTAYLISKLYPIFKSYQIIKNQPWRFVWAPPFSTFGMALCPEWARFDYNKAWDHKFNLFREHNSTGFFAFSPFYKRALFITADPAAIKQIGSSSDFSKPTEIYVGVSHWGDNLLNTDMTRWRRHRKVVAPAFSEKNNEIVWDESLRVLDEWFSEIDSNASPDVSYRDEDILKSTMRMALLVISSAAFGKSLPWTSAKSTLGKKEKTEDLTSAFSIAIEGMTNNQILKNVAPDWSYKLPIQLLKDLIAYYNNFESYMLTMVRERRQEQREGVDRDDILSRLIAASDAETGSEALTERELLSNVYVMMFAGHETTGHTLTATFLLLALYPDIQSLLLQEAHQVFGAEDRPSYSTFSSLKWAQATFYETLRLFPPVICIPRRALVDTHLVVHDVPDDPKIEGETKKIFLPALTDVYIDVIGLNYHPLYWDDPAEFRPSRFIDTEENRWNREAFVPFATGSRQCIGQKFSNVEMVAAISKMVMRYKISIPGEKEEEYKRKEGETEDQRLRRIYKAIHMITLTPTDLQLVFTKRT